MAFHDVRFPVNISYGSQLGPSFSTSLVRLDSGQVEAVSRYGTPHYKYDAGYSIRSQDDLYTVQTFYIARGGPANSFRFFDWMDNASTANGRTLPVAASSVDQVIGTGDGSQTIYYLIKSYTSGSQSRSRRITKPILGSVSISFDTVPQASGWTVNYLTGAITFTTAPAGGVVIRAGFQFDVPVRFSPSIDEDGLMATLANFEEGSLSVPLEEDFDGVIVDDETYYGGSEAISFSANITLALIPRLKILSPTTAGLWAILPDKNVMPQGGPLLELLNPTANTVLIKDITTTVCTLPAVSGGVPGAARILLGNPGGVLTYYGV